MKLWIVMFIVLGVIVVGGLSLEQSILKVTDRLCHTMDLIKDAVRSNQWQEALELHNQVDQNWRKQKKYWDPFIHNQDLDVITVHLARLKVFLESNEKAATLAEIVEMDIQLLQLHEQEILTLKNIL